MNIHEYQAKEVLRRYGVATLKGSVAHSPDEAVAAAKQIGGSVWVVKAQIHAGGRGKGGGVKIAKSIDEVGQLSKNMIGMTLITHQTGPEGKEVQKVYKILKMRDVKIDQTTWNRRYRDYMEKIKTGSIYEISEVLRDLFLLRHSKDLSFGERKMLDQAKALIVKEISIAKQTQEAVIEQEIQQIFTA